VQKRVIFGDSPVFRVDEGQVDKNQVDECYIQTNIIKELQHDVEEPGKL